ncbi:uncharacterized protein LOC102900202 isoform X4 [Felis catus]|uniref:uncharacterized protein LOC102900202 isoform X4 n=1 Tax=Felis catus TaxID=9685 RepID=UPI001D19EEC6|nr:uncharacterized protein LOC102900202 isoform X4 [Felis catus]
MYLGRPSCDPLEKGESRPCLRPGDFPSLASDPDKRVLTVTSLLFKVSQMSVFFSPRLFEWRRHQLTLQPYLPLHCPPHPQRTCCCWNSELSLLPFCFCLSARFFPLPGTPSSQVYWLSSTSHTCLIVVMEKSQQTSTLQKVANSEFGTTYLPLNCQSPAPTLEVMQSWGETQPLPGRWSSLRKPKNPFFKTSIIGRRMQNPCLPLPQPPWGIPAQAGAQPVGEVKPKTGGERPASCAGLRVDGDACEATGPTRGPGYQGPQTARAVGTGDRELAPLHGRHYHPGTGSPRTAREPPPASSRPSPPAEIGVQLSMRTTPPTGERQTGSGSMHRLPLHQKQDLDSSVASSSSSTVAKAPRAPVRATLRAT